VAQRQRQGVGNVGRGRLLGQVKQYLHHPLDLLLAGVAPPRNGLFHLVRAVLDYRYARFGRNSECQTARLSDRHRCPGVGLEKHTLYDNDFRGEPGEKQPELAQQLSQALRERVGRRRGDHPRDYGDRLAALLADRPVPAPRQARVDAQYEH
jgi:hypothetical protein